MFNDGLDMTIRDQDPFFGSIGSTLSDMAGLTATGYDGLSTPIFRSNIFSRRDPSMTGYQYRMANLYSRRMADVSRRYQMQMANSLDRMFDEGSLLGSFMYQRDTGGNYVQSPGTINAYNAIRNFATTRGASTLGGIVNNALGYDRGAAGTVFAKNIDSIVRGTAPGQNASFTAIPNEGTLVYNHHNIADPRYQRPRATAASLATAAFDQAAYNGGLIRDYNTTHGLSDSLMSRMISDAMRGGRLEQKSSLTEEDRERQKSVDRIEDQIKDNKARIADAKQQIAVSGGNRMTIETFSKEIDRLEKQNQGLRKEQTNIRSKMTSYSWDGDFSGMVADAQKDDEDIDRYNKRKEELAGKAAEIAKKMELEASTRPDESTSRYNNWDKRYKSLGRELDRIKAEMADNEDKLKEVLDRSEDRAKELADAFRAIGKEMSSAVSVAKSLYGGSAEEAYSQLYQLTGGGIARNKGAARSLEIEMREFQNIARANGLSDADQALIWQSAQGIAAGAYNVSAPFAGTTVGAQMGAMGARRRAMALAGISENDAATRDKINASAQWREANMNGSSGQRTATMLQYAYEAGVIDKDQYQDLAQELSSGSDSRRKSAFEKLSRVMFNGDVQAGYDFRSNDALINALDQNIKDQSAVRGIMDSMSRNEDAANSQLGGAYAKLNSAGALLSKAGANSQMIESNRNEGMMRGITKKLDDLAMNKNDQTAAAVRNKMNSAYNEARASGMSHAEAVEKALNVFNTLGKATLGDVAIDVELAGVSAATDRFEQHMNKEVNVDLVGESDDFAVMMGVQKHALTKNGKLTAQNALMVGDVMFGDLVESGLSTGREKELFESYKEKYNEAVEKGDFETAVSIQRDMFNAMGADTKTLLGGLIGRQVAFKGEEAAKLENQENPEHQKLLGQSETLKREGQGVSAEGLYYGKVRSRYTAVDTRDKEQAEKDLAEEEKQEKDAYDKAQPGAEAIADTLTGGFKLGKAVNIFKNGNISDETLRDTLSGVVERAGFRAGESGDVLMSMFSEKGAAADGEVSQEKSQSFVEDLLQMAGSRHGGGALRDFYTQISGGETYGQHRFVSNMRDVLSSGNSKTIRATLDNEMERLEKRINETIRPLENRKDLTEDEKKYLARQKGNLSLIQTVSSDLKSGNIDLRDYVGGAAGGGKGGGIDSKRIDDLIDEMGVLIETLNSRIGDGTITP